VKYLYRDQIIS